jgi:hypothetical protein
VYAANLASDSGAGSGGRLNRPGFRGGSVIPAG